MIQLQALNYIIAKNDLNFLSLYDSKYFESYKEVYDFIADHVSKYKRVPDIQTIIERFNDYNYFEVNESRDYLEKRLFEEYVYRVGSDRINAVAPGFAKDAVKTVDIILKTLQEIKPPHRSFGVDIIKGAKDRYDVFVDRQANIANYVFSTGLAELDILLNGGMRRGEELIVIYARTNNAKTWIAEKLAVEVWKQKYNVGFFSPEMTPMEIGYRFDTLFKNFDNHGITGGSADFDSDEYKKYIDALTTKRLPEFRVTTPLDFPEKRVTVSELSRWIDFAKLDFLVIDGLAYLTNERSNNKKNTTENLTEISEDLMTLSIEKKIPIVVVMQANRVGARDSEGGVSTESPELDTIRGSDGISHNASRAISIYKAKDIIKLYISKNRYGEKGQKLYYQYDINTGKFTYTPNPNDGITPEEDDDGVDQLFVDAEEQF